MAETNVVSTSQNTDGSWNITGFYHTLTGDAADFFFNVTLTYNSINQVVKFSAPDIRTPGNIRVKYRPRE